MTADLCAMLGFIPEQYYHLALLVLAAVIFHGILWARNGRFLWSQRRTILFVVLIAEVWMLVTDPIGGWWRAWFFDPNKVLGVWILPDNADRRPIRCRRHQQRGGVCNLGVRLWAAEMGLNQEIL